MVQSFKKETSEKRGKKYRERTKEWNMKTKGKKNEIKKETKTKEEKKGRKDGTRWKEREHGKEEGIGESKEYRKETRVFAHVFATTSTLNMESTEQGGARGAFALDPRFAGPSTVILRCMGKHT
jgi:hypothetical protein